MRGSAAFDAEFLAEAIERHHPDPFRAIGREAFSSEAERVAAACVAGNRPRAVCALMRFAALLGERNGHSGIFPLDQHARPLRFYPFRPYEFDDGVFVVSAVDPQLVGAELVAIGNVEIADVLKTVEPLISRDNDSTVRARRPTYVVAAEVLDGVGVGDGVGQVFIFKSRSGKSTAIELEPVAAATYIAEVDATDALPRRAGVTYLERRDEQRWLDQLEDGSLVIGYNVTRGAMASFADEIAIVARESRPSRVILDIRHNGGGDNRTYLPLLEVLERLAKTTQLFVLISRVTFSAAMQFVVDLERRTNAVFVGEATGGSPNQFGDAVRVKLPNSGLIARIATISWQTAGTDDDRTTREPDIRADLHAADFFAGRDTVLKAAREA